ncbi:putative sucrose transport protein SUC7 [Wickerhamomyces ciferrii]|uniref:Sucrose transport protein SUC7 n=1 Tax=Wickerhamomyces ciferrii (strain ATCC 14091 / BCRC 22168 / CBS 111 / JCM 3599 / NBRC 0793 / NRRL Y-1031 F-60-10) TaxID=1206466 RepID=K0KSV9_WICCF|nr:putative sucrose transport protein SUC7 [Wickerhamomyces ciferrii]CCH45137.1 putative sucrose transport protein SUC7 [Wickerhamomyces ciferrii]
MKSNEEATKLIPDVNGEAGNDSNSSVDASRHENNSTDQAADTSSMISFNETTNLQDSINPNRSFLYIILLTLIIGGLQLSWCTEFTEGTPFLLSLGISKHTLALVWIAGPLSGSLGQPIIGIFSDNCQYRYGRRKPFIIGGCLATCLSLLYLSNSVDLIKLISPALNEDEVKRRTIPFAALGVYLLDFSISAIQAAARAFIVDNVATHQQQIANAMAAIMIGGFNIFGYILGSLKLTKFLFFLGNTQFKVLATFASLVLILTTTISLLFVKERDPTQDLVIKAERKKNRKRLQELGIENPQTISGTILSLYKQTSHSITRLPPQVKIVCLAEFFAWIGYFPMLFYTTTYVGELYKFEFYKNREPGLPPLTPHEQQELLDESTRKGALALLLHSITSFGIDLLLPLLARPKNSTDVNFNNDLMPTGYNGVSRFIEGFRTRYCSWLTVRRSWYISHIIFIMCTISTFVVRSSNAAIFLFAILGITWGNALWAPFVLISEEISRIKEIKTKLHQHKINQSQSDGISASGINKSVSREYEDLEHEAGIILGIHNFFVAAPQVISSLFSSILFKLLSSNDSANHAVYDDSLGWVFRFGGLATVGALIFSIKVRTDEQLHEEESRIFTEDA